MRFFEDLRGIVGATNAHSPDVYAPQKASLKWKSFRVNVLLKHKREFICVEIFYKTVIRFPIF